MDNHTAKHFVLQLGSLVSLYLLLSFLIVLLFGIINIMFPDAADQAWQQESYHSSVRIGIAMVIVFFPTYLVLTRFVNRIRRTETSGAYLALTKWLIYLSLLIGGGVLLGDLVAVIMTFLEGDLTQRFILKAITVLVVVGAAFHYYLLDARGFWVKNEQKSISFGIGAIIVVLASLGYGFANIETPTTVREQNLDARQINDLRTIQWMVQDYYVINKELPADLATLTAVSELPLAPEERAAYTYSTTENGFRLCATFAQPSPKSEMGGSMPIEKEAFIQNPNNWTHGTGEVCFDRSVNKEVIQ